MDDAKRAPLELAAEVAARYAAFSQVEAVALAGSQTSGGAGADSDLDLYVYLHAELSVSARADVATLKAERAEVDNHFWEPGDEWVEAGTGIDVMFRTKAWIEGELERVLVRHEASVGYTTCFWHNVLTSHPLYDRQGWFAVLQEGARQPYPEPLRRAIVAKNHPILRGAISSYLRQLEKAVARGDLISVNHRVAALLVSYFDILLAVNRLPHPGEKRLLTYAERRGKYLPEGMRGGVEALVLAPVSEVSMRASELLDGLDALLLAEGLLD